MFIKIKNQLKFGIVASRWIRLELKAAAAVEAGPVWVGAEQPFVLAGCVSVEKASFQKKGSTDICCIVELWVFSSGTMHEITCVQETKEK